MFLPHGPTSWSVIVAFPGHTHLILTCNKMFCTFASFNIIIAALPYTLETKPIIDCKVFCTNNPYLIP